MTAVDTARRMTGNVGVAGSSRPAAVRAASELTTAWSRAPRPSAMTPAAMRISAKRSRRATSTATVRPMSTPAVPRR